MVSPQLASEATGARGAGAAVQCAERTFEPIDATVTLSPPTSPAPSLPLESNPDHPSIEISASRQRGSANSTKSGAVPTASPHMEEDPPEWGDVEGLEAPGDCGKERELAHAQDPSESCKSGTREEERVPRMEIHVADERQCSERSMQPSKKRELDARDISHPQPDRSGERGRDKRTRGKEELAPPPWSTSASEGRDRRRRRTSDCAAPPKKRQQSHAGFATSRQRSPSARSSRWRSNRCDPPPQSNYSYQSWTQRAAVW